MKRLALLPLLLAGCGTSGAGPSDAPSEEIVYATSFSTDPTLLRPGQFGIYSVTVSGQASSFTTTMKVTGEDAEGLWIEQKVPANPNPFIIKTHISRKGELLESWAGEPRSPAPALVYDHTKGGPPPKSAEAADVKVEVTRETITVAGRRYDCTKLISTITYKNGKVSNLTDWCSMEAPFPLMKDGKPVGGVVRRQYGKVMVELHSMGDNGREELVIPKK